MQLPFLSQASCSASVPSPPPRPLTSQCSSWMLRAILREWPTMKMAATPNSVWVCRFSALICERCSPVPTKPGVAEIQSRDWRQILFDLHNPQASFCKFRFVYFALKIASDPPFLYLLIKLWWYFDHTLTVGQKFILFQPNRSTQS